MLYIKLITIILFLYFSSKAFGLFLKDKLKIKNSSFLGYGYLSNLVLFFILELPAMIFKLSASFFMIMGYIYIIICMFFIIYNFKSLFKFSKKELIAISLSFVFMTVFALFIDFGYIDLHDSYYYSLITNSLNSVKNISVMDPKSGYDNIGNYYKYLSFYYQAGFFGRIFKITLPSLVLIWCMSFMNLFFFSISALTVARISKKKYINNIISVFILTFFLSIVKVPFNFLHLTTMIIPLYLIPLSYKSLYKDKKNIYLYYIVIIASFAGTFSILFLSFALIYLLFITLSLKNEDYKRLLIIAIPTVIFGFILIYESFSNIIWLLIPLFLIILIYYLLKYKIFNKTLNIVGKIFIILIPIILYLSPKIIDETTLLSKMFLHLNEDSSVIVDNDALICTGEISEEFDLNLHGTAMNYVYTNNSSLQSKILIFITHSTLKYAGLIFLGIYGLFKLRKENYFIMLITYLLTFANPLVTPGINLLIYGMNARIILFFTGFFGIVGISYLFDYIDLILKNKKINKLWTTLKTKIWIILLVLFSLSVYFYISLFKNTDFNNYDLLTKTPRHFYKANEVLNDYIDNTLDRDVVLYTSKVFNMTMVDTNIRNKIKIINSSEFMNYFNTLDINNKIAMNLYFENRLIDYNCDIIELLKAYQVDFIVMDSCFIEDEIPNELKIIYNENNIMILTWR